MTSENETDGRLSPASLVYLESLQVKLYDHDRKIADLKATVELYEKKRDHLRQEIQNIRSLVSGENSPAPKPVEVSTPAVTIEEKQSDLSLLVENILHFLSAAKKPISLSDIRSSMADRGFDDVKFIDKTLKYLLKTGKIQSQKIESEFCYSITPAPAAVLTDEPDIFKKIPANIFPLLRDQLLHIVSSSKKPCNTGNIIKKVKGLYIENYSRASVQNFVFRMLSHLISTGEMGRFRRGRSVTYYIPDNKAGNEAAETQNAKEATITEKIKEYTVAFINNATGTVTFKEMLDNLSTKDLGNYTQSTIENILNATTKMLREENIAGAIKDGTRFLYYSIASGYSPSTSNEESLDKKLKKVALDFILHANGGVNFEMLRGHIQNLSLNQSPATINSVLYEAVKQLREEGAVAFSKNGKSIIYFAPGSDITNSGQITDSYSLIKAEVLPFLHSIKEPVDFKALMAFLETRPIKCSKPTLQTQLYNLMQELRDKQLIRFEKVRGSYRYFPAVEEMSPEHEVAEVTEASPAKMMEVLKTQALTYINASNNYITYKEILQHVQDQVLPYKPKSVEKGLYRALGELKEEGLIGAETDKNRLFYFPRQSEQQTLIPGLRDNVLLVLKEAADSLSKFQIADAVVKKLGLDIATESVDGAMVNILNELKEENIITSELKADGGMVKFFRMASAMDKHFKKAGKPELTEALILDVIRDINPQRSTLQEIADILKDKFPAYNRARLTNRIITILGKAKTHKRVIIIPGRKNKPEDLKYALPVN